MKKIFNKDDMYTILNSLDFYSRIWIGQYSQILFDIRWYRDCDILDKIDEECKKLLYNIRHVLLPELDNYGFYASHGIFSDEINEKAAIAYNMQQVFRYTLAYFEHPEGGITVDFNHPIKAELDPYEFPKAKCFKENNETFIEIEIGKEQLNIIKEALQVNKAKLDGNIEVLFKFYTNIDDVLRLANQVSKLIHNANVEREYIDSYEKIINNLKR